MWSPRLFQSTRDAWVAISPAMMINSIRKTPPTPMPRAGWPRRLACSYSISLSTPHRISRAGQKRAKSEPRWWMSMIPIVPSRNSTPIRMSTTGPAIERCGGRGVGIGGGIGGGMIGLATVHLTCRRNWRNGWSRRRRRNWPSRRVRAQSLERNVSLHRCASLQQFKRAHHQQNDRPGAAKVQIRPAQVLQQEQDADGEYNRRPRDPPGAAARTITVRSMRTERAPVAREHPAAEKDQNHRPEAIQAEFGQAHGMQQEEHTDQNEHDRTHRNFAGLDLRSAAKSCRQAERIRYRLRHLDRPGRAHRIDNLVDDEEHQAQDANSLECVVAVILRRISAGEKGGKDGQMRQSLGILPGVHGAHAEGEKSGQNSGDCRVGPAAAGGRWRWRGNRARWCRSVRGRREAARNET